MMAMMAACPYCFVNKKQRTSTAEHPAVEVLCFHLCSYFTILTLKTPSILRSASIISAVGADSTSIMV